MLKIENLMDEFSLKILYDEEPLFVSDEATLLDVWSGDVDEILERCSEHYGVPISLEDAKRPLWKLLPFLDKNRTIEKAPDS